MKLYIIMYNKVVILCPRPEAVVPPMQTTCKKVVKKIFNTTLRGSIIIIGTYHV